MYTTKINYTDFNGTEREDECNFHLNKAELIKLQVSFEGGLEKKMKEIMDKQDSKGVIEILDKLITASYGVKSEDGRRFIKNAEVLDDFMQSEAYSELFMKLCSDEKAASDFVNGIIPKDLAAQAQAQQQAAIASVK